MISQLQYYSYMQGTYLTIWKLFQKPLRKHREHVGLFTNQMFEGNTQETLQVLSKKERGAPAFKRDGSSERSPENQTPL